MSLQQIKDPKKLTEIAKEAVIKYTDQIEINRQLQADNAALREELELNKKAIAWANNSLFGSHGYFSSDRGSPPNEHHLDSKIEELKTYCRKAERENDTLRELLARLVEAAKYRDNIDNTCRDGWDIFRAKVDLKQALASVERHFPNKTSQP